jgi:hypothetical protein
MRWTVHKLYIEEAMISNKRAATTAAAKPLELQVMSGSFALAGNQPANYTLVTGETEALLVDVPFSLSDAHRVVAAILDSGKELTTILVTTAVLASPHPKIRPRWGCRPCRPSRVAG